MPAAATGTAAELSSSSNSHTCSSTPGLAGGHLAMSQQAISPAVPAGAALAAAESGALVATPPVAELSPCTLATLQLQELEAELQAQGAAPQQAALQALAGQQQQQHKQLLMQPAQSQPQLQPLYSWDRGASVQGPSALAGAANSAAKAATQPGRSVKFADPFPDSDDGSSCGGDSNQQLQGSGGAAAAAAAGAATRSNSAGGSGGAKGSSGRRSLPRRSVSSSSGLRSNANEVSEAVLAHQADILRSNKAGKLRLRRGGVDTSFAALQDSLTQNEPPVDMLATRVRAGEGQDGRKGGHGCVDGGAGRWRWEERQGGRPAGTWSQAVAVAGQGPQGATPGHCQ